MVSWGEFAGAEPELAEVGRKLWTGPMIMMLATTRADGSPRVHPVTPVLADGRVFVAIAPRSPKWRDLEHDGRSVLHSLPGERDAEFVMRCRARPAPAEIARVRAAASHVIHDDDHIFEFDIERVDHGWWEHVGQPNTYPVRRRWTPEAGTVDISRARDGSEVDTN